MFSFFQTIIDFFKTIIDLVINLVKSTFTFLQLLVQGVPNAFTAVGLMPPFLIAGLTATISITLACVLIGRRSS